MTERERLIETICEGLAQNCGGTCTLPNKMYCQNCHILADYLLANGVIVPPVMAGQKVYLSRSLMNDVIEGEVTGLKTTEFSKYTVVFLIDDNRYIEIPFGAYGETVFLAKEEAEKALHKINHNSLCETETYKIKQ